MDNTHTIAWLAGLLEGEGSFNKGIPSRPIQAAITLEMTDEDVIKKVAKLWDVKYCKPRVRNIKWKQTYKLHVRGTRAMKWINEIYPYMGIRRQKKLDEIIVHCTK